MPYYKRRYYKKSHERKIIHHERPTSSWSDYILPFVRGAASAIPYGKIFEGIYSGANEVYKAHRGPSVRPGTYTSDWRDHIPQESYEEIIRPGWGRY